MAPCPFCSTGAMEAPFPFPSCFSNAARGLQSLVHFLQTSIFWFPLFSIFTSISCLVCLVWWVNLGQQLRTHQPLTNTPLAGWGRELEKQWWEKLTGEGKDSLISKGKREKKRTSVENAVTCHLPPAERCPAGLQAKSTLESLPTIFITKHGTIWYGISLWSVGVNCYGCVPSKPLTHPQPTPCGGRARNREDLDAKQALLSNN